MGKLSIEEFAGGADRRCLVPSAGGAGQVVGESKNTCFSIALFPKVNLIESCKY